jgi:hypothetical protein
MQNKQSIGSMKLLEHKRDTVLWHSYVHVLEPWDLLHFDILLCSSGLAMLELRQHDPKALLRLQGMDPLDDSEHAQYLRLANCFRASSAQIATVMAKATIMRLTCAPSLPAVAPVSGSRRHLAHNNPGVSS